MAEFRIDDVNCRSWGYNIDTLELKPLEDVKDLVINSWVKSALPQQAT